MHESSLVMSMLDIIKETVTAHKAERVSKVTLVLGELASVEAHSLSSCFEVFAEGTVAEGAELVFERIAATKSCLECGETYNRKDNIDICPKCGGKIDLKTGREFYLKSMELEGNELGEDAVDELGEDATNDTEPKA